MFSASDDVVGQLVAGIRTTKKRQSKTSMRSLLRRFGYERRSSQNVAIIQNVLDQGSVVCQPLLHDVADLDDVVTLSLASASTEDTFEVVSPAPSAANPSKSSTSPLTLFSWGYWGWGNSTRQLIDTVDAIEEARGFAAPIFVDARLSRSVRASGFSGNAFERAIGSDRYLWLDGLGNSAIHEGGRMRLKDQSDVSRLLDVATTASQEIKPRRVIFFCACSEPGVEGEERCHRTMVASYLLQEAAKSKTSICVVEWPGGREREVRLEIPLKDYQALARGAATLPLPSSAPISEFAALPWGSLIHVSASSQPTISFMSGPAIHTREQWRLPVKTYLDMTVSQLRQLIPDWREEIGYEPRYSKP